MIDKQESRRIRAQIRDVLMSRWDPIGIEDIPEAQDEYDGYIGRIYELLRAGASERELIVYLYWAVHDHMGLDLATKADMQQTAAALQQIQFTQHEG